jgi:DNA-binding helix-hairpin-helix protein with protein kinase domain
MSKKTETMNALRARVQEKLLEKRQAAVAQDMRPPRYDVVFERRIAADALESSPPREAPPWLADVAEALGAVRCENGCGCDCDCGHHYEEHDADCARCFACRIGEAVSATEST